MRIVGEVGGGLDPLGALEQAVPVEQRPVNELAAIKQSMFYSWGMLEPQQYVTKLAQVFAVMFLFFSAPIANQTFDVFKQVGGRVGVARP
jgi:hypothetical protein